MGAIGEALAAYARPLVDQTDGSFEQMEKALQLSTLCFTLAQLPKASREELLAELQSSLKMDDAVFDDFRHSVILPMIERHERMFPGMHGQTFKEPRHFVSRLPERPSKATRAEKRPVVDRYAPCPCNSGKKYKFCCGVKPR